MMAGVSKRPRGKIGRGNGSAFPGWPKLIVPQVMQTSIHRRPRNPRLLRKTLKLRSWKMLQTQRKILDVQQARKHPFAQLLCSSKVDKSCMGSTGSRLVTVSNLEISTESFWRLQRSRGSEAIQRLQTTYKLSKGKSVNLAPYWTRKYSGCMSSLILEYLSLHLLNHLK